MKNYKKIINREFKFARELTETVLSIELKLGELFELRKYVGFTINTFVENSRKKLKTDSVIDPAYEASLIFMNKNYGTQIYNLDDQSNFDIKRTELKELLGFDYYPEYFKRVQEEMYLP